MARIKDIDSAAAALELRIKSEPLPHGCFDIKMVIVKKGPQAYKTATLWLFGNPETGEIRRRELRVRSWDARMEGPGYRFEEKPNAWACEGAEIEALAAFLNGQLTEAGMYRRIDDNTALEPIIRNLLSGGTDSSRLVEMVDAIARTHGAVEVLARSEAGNILLEGVQRAQQRDAIAQLRTIVDNPASKEQDFQRALEDGWWMFGGRYVAKGNRRALTARDQLDIPLIRADGVLQIVELKAANIAKLVVEQRKYYIVGPEVNAAVGQAMNYLRSLDEKRDTIKNEFGVDCRRASATVVIGHPRYVTGVNAASAVNEAIRIYNSHLSLVEVITYADLINGAEGALSLSGDANEQQEDFEAWAEDSC